MQPHQLTEVRAMNTQITCEGRSNGQPVGLTYCLDKRDHGRHEVDIVTGDYSVVARSPEPPDGYFGQTWGPQPVASDSGWHIYSDGFRTVSFRRGKVVIAPDVTTGEVTLSGDELAWIAGFQQWKDKWS